MIVLDLFCGLGGFSAAFVDRGHDVVGVDLLPPATIRADVRQLPFASTFKPDVIVASPPCIEFARESMPWCRTGKKPSMELVNATFAAVERFQPRWWVMENVRGATKWIKEPYSLRIGSRYLWGEFPLFLIGQRKVGHGKEKLGPDVPDRSRQRAIVPYEISDGLCRALEAYLA